MSEDARPQQVAVLRVDQAGIGRSARAALGKGPTGQGLTFAKHGLGSRIAVAPPRNVYWTRVFSFSVWETEADLDRADIDWSTHRSGTGWSARLQPLRVWQKGHTVIDPDGLAAAGDDEPVISVTASEAIPRHIPAFLRASRPVEQQVLDAEGLLWTMGFFQPPTWFSTITMWQSGEAADSFAYSDAGGGAHRKALPLVHNWFNRSTTMRFRPYRVCGSLTGDLPLDASWLIA